MGNIISVNGSVSTRIIEIRGLKVLLDSDVAELYGIETKAINQAVNRNHDRFPDGYIIKLTPQEKQEVVTNCDHLQKLKFSSALPKAFTEKALYMLATVLKSPAAIATTLEIIETFTQVREINRSIVEIIKDPENEPKQKSLLNRAGLMISKLIMPTEDDLEVVEVESTYKINVLASLEFTKKTKKIKKKL